MHFRKKVLKAIKEREAKEKKKLEASHSLAEVVTKGGDSIIVLPKAMSSMKYFRDHMLVTPTDGLYHDNGKLVAKAIVPGMNEAFYVDVTDDGELVVPPDAPSSSTIIIGSDSPTFITNDLESACTINRYTQHSCAIPLLKDGIKQILKVFPEAKLIADSFSGDAFVDDRTLNINAYERTETDAIKFEGRHFTTLQEYYEEGGDIVTHLKVDSKFVIEPFWRMFKRFKRQKWIVKDLIPAGPSLILLFSPSGVGKTFLIIDLSMSIATGKGSWNGRPCESGKILYFCGEGKATLVPRIAAWCQEHGVKDLRGIEFYAEDGLFDVANPDTYENLLKTIEVYFAETPPVAMIFDTMNLFMGEGDENSTKDANRFIQAIKEATLNTNCAIILVHHTGVSNEERARGSSVFKGALDSELRLEKSKRAGSLILTQTKSRYGKEINPLCLKLKEVTLEGVFIEDGGEEEVNCVMVPAENDTPFVGALVQDVDFVVKACRFYEKTLLTRKEMLEYAKSGAYDGPISKDTSVKLNKAQKGKTLWRLIENAILEEIVDDSFKVVDPIVLNLINSDSNTADD